MAPAQIMSDSRSPHTQLSESSMRPHPLSKEEGVRSTEYGSGSKDVLVKIAWHRHLGDARARVDAMRDTR